MPTPTKGEVYEDSGAVLMARVQGEDATNITQAGTTAVTYKVFDADSTTPNTAVATGTLTVADVIFDALQTDARWTLDSTGYNFRHTMAASVFNDPNHRYEIEYLFDPVSGEDFFVLFHIYTRPVRTS